jgi:hypothetical protein
MDDLWMLKVDHEAIKRIETKALLAFPKFFSYQLTIERDKEWPLADFMTG